jgi:glycosyltransferase involved in cell wall biosynthesis
MTRAGPPTFAIIIPCYNEERIIRQTVAELQQVFPAEDSWEMIVVNDGSSDGSRQILDELASQTPKLEVVHHERNRGYGAALKTGIRRTSAELILITDADGTYPHERLPELLDVARHADMVVGARIAADVEYPLIRKIPKLFLRRYASWLAGQSIPDINSGMRVFRRSVAERFLKILPDTFSFTTTITISMLTNRYDVRFIPIGYKTRVGKSKIKPVRDTLRFCQLLVRTGMYFAPLRVLLPLIAVLTLMFSVSIGYDVLVLDDLTEKSLILLLFAMNTAIFALLADMIDKRSP